MKIKRRKPAFDTANETGTCRKTLVFSMTSPVTFFCRFAQQPGWTYLVVSYPDGAAGEGEPLTVRGYVHHAILHGSYHPLTCTQYT
jgi:hypothetical protein